MNKNDAVKTHRCVVCDYSTNRKYDLQRHHTAKHPHAVTPVCENVGVANCCKNVIQYDENVIQDDENVIQDDENVIHHFSCNKCNKKYKTKKSFVSHELKCKGINILTCPKCMVSFTTRHAKSKHLANNKCKPRSIIHARTPNIANINTQNNIDTQNNITTQNNNNTIIINNYGNERMDYLDYDKMLEIFKTAYNIPSMLTKYIHFNKDFPENKNIINNKNDKNHPLVKMDDEYIFRNINNLVEELVKDKTRMMHNFAAKNKDDICVKMDTKIYETIIDLLLKLLLLQQPSEHYKIQLAIIRDMIKNSNP
jgi:hypothetical protein